VSWQPLLEGSLKYAAIESLQGILNDLAHFECDFSRDPSLAGGLAGLAILHGYLAKAGHGQQHADAADRDVHRACAPLADKPMEASLYRGLTGVGWALAHLQDPQAGFDNEDDCAEIDDVLLDHLEPSPWRGDYDLIGGLVGFGVYALERIYVTRPESANNVPTRCLERVIEHLAATAEKQNAGITWWSDPAWLPAETREKSPNGYYNLGLAHGVPGVIALLGSARAAGVAGDKARPLLEGAVRWLLAQQESAGFGYCVQSGNTDGPGRLAWCYGDPGVAAALLSAARCVADTAWEGEALAIARRATQRPVEQSGVRDAGLCHGAAGLGHLFNRMYQATGDEQLSDTARYWFKQTLEMRHPGDGIGGYRSWQAGPDGGELTWVTEPGLLTGAVGIALALSAATSAVEPNWDRMLLTAIPPKNRR
jgi:lantibiotic modifying enzyme